MYKIFILSSLLICLTSYADDRSIGANAAPPLSEVDWDSLSSDPSPYFLSRGIGSIRFSGVQGLANRKNYATLPAEQVTPDLEFLANQTSGTLSGIARFFDLSPEVMFGVDGIDLSIKAKPLGPIGSNDDTMGVFPDWTLDEGLSSGIFAHEMGHNICSHPRNFSAPEVLHELDSFFVFQEFFADWLAYKATGTTDLLIRNIDMSAFHLRGQELTTYNLPSGPFSHERGQMDLINWIRALQGKATRTHRESELVSAVAGEFPEQLPTLDSGPIDVGNIRKLDSHQLGTPLFIFFKDLENQIGRDLTREFRAALHALGAQVSTDRTFTVHLEGYEANLEDYIKIVVKTPRHFISAFREQLRLEGEKRSFDHLYISRAIERGLSLEEDSIMRAHVVMKAENAVRELFGSHGGNGQGIYNRSSPFYDEKYGVKPNLPWVISPSN